MSHEVETMAYAGQVPWHGLGVKVSDDVSVDEMLVAAGLDWELQRRPLFTKNAAGELSQVPAKRAIVRSSDEKVMTIAGQHWQPFQNREMLGFFRDYAAAGGAKLETAGSLRKGSVVWGLANLSDGFNVGRKGSRDRVDGFLLFKSPHTVGKAITIATTTVRVVCANTMAMADEEGVVEYSQSHVGAFNFDAARSRVEAAHDTLRRAGERANTLSKLKLSLPDATRFLAPYFDAGELSEAELSDVSKQPKKLKEVLGSLLNAPGAEPDNAWGVLNGVTHWCDHVSGYNANARMFRSWAGDHKALKLKVEKGLLELV